MAVGIVVVATITTVVSELEGGSEEEDGREIEPSIDCSLGRNEKLAKKCVLNRVSVCYRLDDIPGVGPSNPSW